jgi:phosphate transport system substrate-binding protein
MPFHHVTSTILASLLAATLAVPAIAAAPTPQSGYLLPDGSIAIVGNDGMEKLLTGMEAIVTRTEPGMHATFTLKGSSTGLPALAADATLFAPLAREAWRGELAGFKQIHGYEATAIRIGYSGWGPRPTGKTPPAIYVAKANPLAAVSITDLGRVFTSGSMQGDINLWSQLGARGDDAGRRIHIYGLRDDGGFATAFRDRYFGKRPYGARYEPLESYGAVIRAVAADRYGIAIVGWADPARVTDAIRILPVTAQGAAAATPSRETVAAGAYPLSAGVYFYIDKAPAKPLDPLVKVWLEAALSDAGQQLIAAEADSEEGYLPLSSSDLAAERAKLTAL